MNHPAKVIVVGAVIIASVVGLVVYLSLGLPSGLEKQHLFYTAFSHPEITRRVGTVKDVEFVIRRKENVPFFAKQHVKDWRRHTDGAGVVAGAAGFWIQGSSEAGVFTVSYSYDEKTDTYTVVQVDCADFDHPGTRLNQSPKETPAKINPVDLDQPLAAPSHPCAPLGPGAQ